MQRSWRFGDSFNESQMSSTAEYTTDELSLPDATRSEESTLARAQASAKLPEEARSSLFADWAEIGKELWQYRELVYQFTLRDIRVRYKQAALGFAWAIFLPVLIVRWQRLREPQLSLRGWPE